MSAVEGSGRAKHWSQIIRTVCFLKTLGWRSQPCLSESRSDFSATFTTFAFDNSSLRRLERRNLYITTA
ncbi:MAG: hypothetical protein WAV78_02445, partial [Xanthobacteraceae bacterium]